MAQPSPAPTGPRPALITLRRLWLGLLLLSALIAAVTHFGDIKHFLAQMQRAEPAWLVVALLLQVATYFSVAELWRRALLRGKARVPLASLVPLGLAKLFSDQALPTGGMSGTAFLVAALSRRGVSAQLCMAVLLVSLVAYYAAYLLFATASVLLLWLHHAMQGWIIATALVFGLVAVAIPAGALMLQSRGRRPLPPLMLRIPGLRAMLGSFSEVSPAHGTRLQRGGRQEAPPGTPVPRQVLGRFGMDARADHAPLGRAREMGRIRGGNSPPDRQRGAGIHPGAQGLRRCRSPAPAAGSARACCATRAGSSSPPASWFPATSCLRAGDIVPADVRLLAGTLDIDQSALTGESQEVDKAAGDVLPSGSVVRRGESTGVVMLTGVNTYFGRTTELVREARPKLHLETVVAKVVRWSFAIVGTLLGGVAALSLLRGGVPLGEMLPLMLVLLMSAVPVALPVMFTVSMAVGAKELARRGVLIIRLSSAEDAATMDVLCVDKTGTLTMNQLAITNVVLLCTATEADVLFSGALASQEANQDPIDQAFLSEASRRRVWAGRPVATTLAFTPFDATTRRTEAIIEQYGRRLRVMKGAVRTIAQACGLPPAAIEALEFQASTSSLKGQRTLAVAQGPEGERHAARLGKR